MRRFHAFLTGVMQVNITSFFSPCKNYAANDAEVGERSEQVAKPH